MQSLSNWTRSVLFFLISFGSASTGLFQASLPAQETGDFTSTDTLQVAKYEAHDTLAIAADDMTDAQECLEGLAWKPSAFEAETVINSPKNAYELRFPSPRPSGVAEVDQVVCEWYPAMDQEGQIRKARATIVIHESGSKMTVGRLVAREIGRRGMHAFMVQMPGYGSRRADGFSTDNLVEVFKQGVADARRARDAVAALPCVDGSHIGIQGTSLGGFVATLTSSLDKKFDRQVLVLCGGDLHGVLTQGAKDAKKTLERLLATGVREADLESLLAPIEPLRIAHRLPQESTWLFYASFDSVVPPKNAKQLAECIKLAKDHQKVMLANHYTGIAYLPGIIEKVVED